MGADTGSKKNFSFIGESIRSDVEDRDVMRIMGFILLIEASFSGLLGSLRRDLEVKNYMNAKDVVTVTVVNIKISAIIFSYSTFIKSLRSMFTLTESDNLCRNFLTIFSETCEATYLTALCRV